MKLGRGSPQTNSSCMQISNIKHLKSISNFQVIIIPLANTRCRLESWLKTGSTDRSMFDVE